MIDRRVLSHIDWVTISVAVLLAGVGLMSIYSATHVHMPSVYTRETWWVGIGIAAMMVALAVNYTLLERFSYHIYTACLALLFIVLVAGSVKGGAQRWISLGGMTFQPSEFTKLALILALARYFSLKPVPPRGLNIRELTPPALIMLAPFLLIAAQPDLGTAIILWMIFWSMVLTVKVRPRTLVAIFVSLVAVAPLGWHMLKGYQKARLMSFLDPTVDPMGSGYHVMQSKIAIGSGGFFGKGFTEGTQGKLMFLPEHHTDFIFAILAEEWGLVGTLIVLGLFLGLLLCGLNTAREAKDRFGLLVAVGITALFFWHVVINLGMVTGILPVVGVPLPFMSYGGSFLLTSMVACGILISIKMRRFIF